MSKRDLNLKIKELKSDMGVLKDVEISIGRIYEETWTEPVGPTPEHLFTTAETKEEDMMLIAKFCMRPNDTSRGRSIKLTHYIDLHSRLYGVMPDDIHLFGRTLTDIPVTMKSDVIKILEENNWKESIIPDPTLLQRMIRKKKK